MRTRTLPVLAFLIAIAIFFVYVNPVWTSTIASLKAGIAADDQGLSAAADFTKRQNELASARSAMDPNDLAKLESLLPDSVDNVGLILDLDALAARSSLSLANIDVANAPGQQAGDQSAGLPAGGDGPVGSVDLSLTAVGTYAAFAQFLSGIEQSARLLDVRDIVVNGSDTGVYTYQMTVRLYWLR